MPPAIERASTYIVAIAETGAERLPVLEILSAEIADVALAKIARTVSLEIIKIPRKRRAASSDTGSDWKPWVLLVLRRDQRIRDRAELLHRKGPR